MPRPSSAHGDDAVAIDLDPDLVAVARRPPRRRSCRALPTAGAPGRSCWSSRCTWPGRGGWPGCPRGPGCRARYRSPWCARNPRRPCRWCAASQSRRSGEAIVRRYRCHGRLCRALDITIEYRTGVLVRVERPCGVAARGTLGASENGVSLQDGPACRFDPGRLRRCGADARRDQAPGERVPTAGGALAGAADAAAVWQGSPDRVGHPRSDARRRGAGTR